MIGKLLAGLLLLVVFSLAAAAQRTEFAYQGNLRDGGAPANGHYDFEFRLYDALSDGA